MTDEQNDKRFELDPKIAARNERYTPEVEKLLRLNMDLDGPKGTSKKFRDNYDRVFGAKPHPYEPPPEVEAAEALQEAGPRADDRVPEAPYWRSRCDNRGVAIQRALDALNEGKTLLAHDILIHALDL
jgi:hypothetical protein